MLRDDSDSSNQSKIAGLGVKAMRRIGCREKAEQSLYGVCSGDLRVQDTGYVQDTGHKSHNNTAYVRLVIIGLKFKVQ